MKYLLMCLVLVFVIGCAHSQICREKTVYMSEISFFEQASLQQAEKLEWVIKTQCKCLDGDFVTDECRDIAKLVITVKTRIPWHKAMMLYNAGISESRPPETPPTIPPLQTLCPE